MIGDNGKSQETVEQADWAAAFRAAVEAHRAGRLDEAETVYRRLLAIRPDDAEVRHMLGVAQLQTGRAHDALASIRRAIAGNPMDARFHNNLGNALMNLGRPSEALVAFQQALDRDADFVTALYNRGTALLALRRTNEAAQDLRAVLQREPENLDARTNLGAVLIKQKRLEEAVALFRESLERAPENVGLLSNLASALEMQNALDAAAEAAHRAVAADPQAPGPQFLLARLDHRAGRLVEARTRLESLLSRDLTPAQAIDAWLELGLILDRLGAAEDALSAIQKGKVLAQESPAARGVRGERFLERVEANRTWFTGERLVAAPRADADDGRRPPVFFVGFPRSGTTLVERVLAAHPAVVTTEESSPITALLRPYLGGKTYPEALGRLTTGDLNRQRDRFWALAEDRHGALKDCVLVDKLPLNIVDLGFINLLFPDSPVIVALRDPRDVCLSCYMQSFKLNDAMANFLDLSETVRTYQAVMGLWLHYRAHLTLPWMEYCYETLVDDFEGTLKGILAFIGLEWHSEMADYRRKSLASTVKTPSYRDVTGEIHHRSVGRWRAYQTRLAPQFEALAPFVAAFGYPPD